MMFNSLSPASSPEQVVMTSVDTDDWAAFLKDYVSPHHTLLAGLCSRQGMASDAGVANENSTSADALDAETKQRDIEFRSRRQAQNRAAQRAFRQRRETHSRELETANKNLKDALALSRLENLALKQRLLRAQTNNQVLSVLVLSANSAPGTNKSEQPRCEACIEERARNDESPEFVRVNEVWKMAKIQQALGKESVDLGQLSAKLVEKAILGKMTVNVRKDDVLRIVEELELCSSG